MKDHSKQFGKYVILDVIGKGVSATVYRALDKSLDREVALKMLDPILMRDPAWIKRFRREARIIANLRHPHIVRIWEIDQLEGELFIAMDLAKDGNLADLIKRKKRLDWNETKKIASAIGSALDYAHDKNLVHGDIKPANVLIDREVDALLTDFGFAKIIAQNSVGSSLTGGIVGTPAYIAPEVWNGEKPTPQTDIYALGCIVYEMVTGQQLFTGKTSPAVMLAHFKPPAFPDVWPEGIPEGLTTILAKAMSKDPDKRYATAGEFIQALQFLGTEDTSKMYGVLLTAIAAHNWDKALQLIDKIKTVDPNFGDLKLLEKQVIDGINEDAKQANIREWTQAVEAALASGELGDARLLIDYWLQTYPNDSEGLRYRSLLHDMEEDQSTAASVVATPVAAASGISRADKRTKRNRMIWGIVLLAWILLIGGITINYHAIKKNQNIAESSTNTVITPGQDNNLQTQLATTATIKTPPTSIPTHTPTSIPTYTPTFVPTHTPTSVPTSTPRPISPPTPEPPHAVVSKIVNVRGGPGTVYPILGKTKPGNGYIVLGRNHDSSWYQIQFDDKKGWIAASLVTLKGPNQSRGSIGEVKEIPPTPKAPVYGVARGRIVYAEHVPLSNTYKVYMINADGSGKTLIKDNASEPSFTPDGRSIVYYDWSSGVSQINIDGSNDHPIYNALNSAFPSISPDGTKLVYMTWDLNWGWDPDSNFWWNISPWIEVRNADGSGQYNRVVDGDAPDWAPDNTRLVYKGCEGPGGSVCGIMVVNIATKERHRLTDYPDDGNPVWSPDGRYIAFSRKVDETNIEIFVMNSDGSNQRRLTYNPTSDGMPAWFPDSKHLAFRSDRDGQWGIYVMNLSGSGVRKITNAHMREHWTWERMKVTR